MAESGATSYLVLRSTDDNPLNATAIGSTEIETSFVDETVEEGTIYHYWIAPVTSAGVGVISAPSTVLIRPKTKESPAPVLHEWLDRHALAPDGDYEAAAVREAANGYSVWQCYVAGVDPNSATNTFLAKIAVVDGEPVVTPFPDLGTNRVYTVVGRSSLSDPDEDWHEPDGNSRFFRVKVSLPE